LLKQALGADKPELVAEAKRRVEAGEPVTLETFAGR
jgi:hypothetical protein